MRCVALAAVLLTAACGDNGPTCGYVDLVVGERNVWAPMLAVDEQYIYYADYDIDGGGTRLMLRGSREGGGLRSLGQIGYTDFFGNGLAYDDLNLYWTASSEPTGYSLYVTPRVGGPQFPIAALPECVPFGATTSDTEIFIGMAACQNLPARVTAISKADSSERVAWEAGMYDGDVRALAYANDTLFIGTSIALFAVDASGPRVITAGNAVRHLEVHGDQLYYASEADGIYRMPVSGGPRERLYAFASSGARQGAFSLDGDDLYISEPPEILFMTLTARNPRVVVTQSGPMSELVARDGYAWWSTLAFPNSPGGLDTFSGAIARISRPCD